MRAFLRRNIYWLLLTAFLLCLAAYRFPQARPGAIAADLPVEDVRVLERPVHVNVDKVLLHEVIAALAKEAQCTVVCDPGLGPPDCEITVHSKQTVTLKEALLMALRSYDPSLAVGIAIWQEGGIVMVGPQELMMRGPRVTVVYDVAPLLGQAQGAAREKKMEDLAKAVGEPFALAEYANSNGTVGHFDDKLIVRAPRPVQREIAATLQKLESR